MKITRDISFHIKNINIDIMNEISKYENKDISESSQKSIDFIKKNISKIKDELDDYELIVKLLNNLNIKNLTNFLMDIETLDNSFFSELLLIINQLEKNNERYAKEVSEKLSTIYTISLLKNVFSENRVASLQIAANSYK
jgi:hypothetical protein